MIKTTLPVVEKQINAEGKLAVNKKNINVAIDTSLFAEERWEQNFPHNAKNETLFAYIERTKAAGTIETRRISFPTLKPFIALWKGAIYPISNRFVNFSTLPTANTLTNLSKRSSLFSRSY